MTEEEVRQQIKDNEVIEWGVISRTVKLSEDFIIEYADKVWWTNIQEYQVLSEEFIKDHADIVYWFYISKYQKLSNRFILENFDILYPRRLLENYRLELSPQIKAMCQIKTL
jgi:hypothetical protein